MGLQFVDADDLVNCGSAASLDNLKAGGGQTISCFVKFTNTGGGDGSYDGRMVSKSDPGSGATGGWDFFFNLSAGKTDIIFQHKGTGTTLIRETENSVGLSVNTLYHLAVTWDGSTTAANIHIYINGVEATYATTTNATGSLGDDSTNSLFIGNVAGATRGLFGTISEVALWNTALSAGNIAILANGGNLRGAVGKPLTIATTNLKAYWPLSDFADGTTANSLVYKDQSGNSNDGTGNWGSAGLISHVEQGYLTGAGVWGF